ncbi:MAG: hypothetical protein ACREBC_00710, partial [Pyrinomonadaceae bacterium]
GWPRSATPTIVPTANYLEVLTQIRALATITDPVFNPVIIHSLFRNLPDFFRRHISLFSPHKK